jgi:hypothetical protein
VIDGFRRRANPLAISGSTIEIHVLDPLRDPAWESFDPDRYSGLWAAGPAANPSHPPLPLLNTGVRHDEDSVWTDSDGDGLYDFDEIERFNTMPDNADSDGDGVPDLADIREYAFDGPACPDSSLSLEDCIKITTDFDGDGVRKELDGDSDDDGCSDGGEDANSNGVQDPGETSNFSNDCLAQPVP